MRTRINERTSRNRRADGVLPWVLAVTGFFESIFSTFPFPVARVSDGKMRLGGRDLTAP